MRFMWPVVHCLEVSTREREQLVAVGRGAVVTDALPRRRDVLEDIE
jgi:hypothetical protein